ncbi:metal/formaldehyde-sensitive transcriptional repressor [Acerihabitans arboris]|uniref:Metal-sensing transcriptional repressor n=1 Tax=Acerihabitans arboris TaxID=2691583 RepID=A0A845SKJ1_9GAMM|nr:metal/formaldehyde-sensitive transcriptional repressor [Acerihabitans arboris]NDL61835.1 metal-sensing transcriptional repressor [Acerihabitans arboris]
MPRSAEDKKRALLRVKRIKGQVEALERGVASGVDCGALLQQIAAIRGASHGLMSEIMEIHIRDELGEDGLTEAQKITRLNDVASLVRSYLK